MLHVYRRHSRTNSKERIVWVGEWHQPVIPASGTLKEEDHRLEAIPGYILRHHHKHQQRWGDGSGGKVMALQAREPEFNFQNP